MSLPFEGKVTLITGGAKGIGKATARKFAAQGSDIVIVYYNSSEEASALVKEIQEQGRKAIAIQANVADRASVQAMMETVLTHFKAVHFLISNAASGVLKPALSMSTKHFDWCMKTNALALHHLAVSAKDHMPFGARLIALSSLGASRAIPHYAFIGASKAALEALVRSLALEMAPQGITVNTVSAGVVDTDALQYFPNREQLLQEYLDHSLAGKPLQPEDVANAIYLLCLPEAQRINGHTLLVDDGYSILG